MPTLLRQMDMISLTCAHIWMRAAHTNMFKQVYTRVDSDGQEKTVPHYGTLMVMANVNSDEDGDDERAGTVTVTTGRGGRGGGREEGAGSG